MAKSVRECTVGMGKVYVKEFEESTGIPTDDILEAEENFHAHTSGGITFEYTKETSEIEDDLAEVVDIDTTKETLNVKFGLMSHDAASLQEICQSAVVNKTTDKITTTIGGKENETDKYFIIRFVHTDRSGKNTRYTAVGKNSEGFTIGYNKGEASVIDVTFKCFAKLSNGSELLKIEQDI